MTDLRTPAPYSNREGSRAVVVVDDDDESMDKDVFNTLKSPAGTAKTCLTRSSHSPPSSWWFAEAITPKTLESSSSSPRSNCTSPGTPELLSKLHDLESQHSRLSECCHSLCSSCSTTDLLHDDETSFLSMESAGMIMRRKASSSPAAAAAVAAATQQRKKLVRIIGIPATPASPKSAPRSSPSSNNKRSGGGSDSVFERLYQDAQDKMERARRRSSDQYLGPATAAATASLFSYGSYDYSTQQQQQQQCRRLSYMPSMISSQRFRTQQLQQHYSSNVSLFTSPLADNAAASVFERLYRNQPRSQPVWYPPSPPPWEHRRRQHHHHSQRQQPQQQHNHTKKATSVAAAVAAAASAAVRIQAWWRMTVLSNEFETLQYCATVIQVAYRKYYYHRCRTATTTAAAAATVVISKAVAATTTAVDDIDKRKRTAAAAAAATRIQAWWRMAALQCELEILHYCAAVVQSAYRKYYHKKNHQCTASSSSSSPRSVILGLKEEEENNVAAAAAVLRIQAWWKMTTCQTRYETWRFCALVIQKAYRKHQSLARCKLAAAITIQSWWRMIQRRIGFETLRFCAVTLQKVFRKHLLKRRRSKHIHTGSKLQVENKGSRTIQEAWRRHLCQKSYQQTKLMAVSVQAAYRGKRDRKRQLQMSEAAMLVQKNWRRYRVQLQLMKLHATATMIQATIRRHQCQLYHLHGQRECVSKVNAAVCIQTPWHCHRAQSNYHAQSMAATRIQSAVRGRQHRMEFVRLRGASILIQSFARCHLARKHYSEETIAVLQIQTAWRSAVARDILCVARSATLLIQSTVRGYLCRESYSNAKGAVCVLQRNIRGYQTRSWLGQCQTSAHQLQTIWRGHKARLLLHDSRTAAIIIQAVRRGTACRSVLELKRKETERSEAALHIQCVWRLYWVRDRYLWARSAVLMIQALVRGRIQRKTFNSVKMAAIILQAWSRGISARKSTTQRFGAIRCIQSEWRRYVLMTQLHIAKSAAAMIQAAARGRIQKKRFSRLVHCVAVLQARYRFGLVLRLNKVKAHAAEKIQRAWRRSLAESTLSLARQAVMVIQAVYRGQAMRRRYLRVVWASSMIQVKYRERLFQRQKHQAVTRIQATWRRYIAECSLFNECGAAMLIQAAFRGQAMRRSYLLLVKAVLSLQAKHRRYLSRQQKHASIVIQGACRKYLAIVMFSEALSAAIMIQSTTRMYTIRQNYNLLKESTIAVQAFVRFYLAKTRITRMQTAAVSVQSAWRSYAMACRFIVLRTSASLIQAAFRRHIQRSRYYSLKDTVVLCQAWRRRKLFLSNRFTQSVAAAKIQRTWALYQTQRQWKKNTSLGKTTLEVDKEVISISLPSIQSHASADMQRIRRPASPAVAVKVLEHINEHCVRVKLCPVRSLRQRHAARRIQSFVRRVVLPNCSHRPFRPTVTVHILDCVSKDRLRVEFCPTPTPRDKHSAIAIQSFARAAMQQCKEADQQLDQEQCIYKSVLHRAEEEAKREVEALLTGSTEATTPCVARLAFRARQAFMISLAGGQSTTPEHTNGVSEILSLGESSSSRKTLFSSPGFDSLLSPIKASPQN